MTFPDDNDKSTYVPSITLKLGNDPLEIEANESDFLLPKNHFPTDRDSLLSRALPWHKTPSIYWLLPAFFVVAVTYGIGIAPKVKFYVDVVCRDYYSSKQENTTQKLFVLNNDELPDDMCNIPEVQAEVSQLILVLNLCTAIPGVFVLGTLGSLSDRWGRRMILFLASVGMAMLNLCILLAGNFWSYFGIKFLIIGYLMEGLSGGVLLFITVSYAYIADCTTSTQRNAVFGLLQGVIIMGFSLGPMISGWLVDAMDNIMSSIPLEKQLENQRRYQDELRNHSLFWKWFGVLNLFKTLSILMPRNQKGASRNAEELEDEIPTNAGKYSLLKLAGINILIFGVITGTQQIFLLYTSYVFDWSIMDQGYVLFLGGFSRAVVLLVVYPMFLRLFKKWSIKDDRKVIENNVNDRDATRKSRTSSPTVLDEVDKKKELLTEVWIIRVGLAVDAISYLFFGLATNSTTFFAAAISNPTIKSLETKLIPKSQVGQLLGAISVLDSIIRIISPTLFYSMYSLLVKTSPHLIWYGVTGMMATALLLTLGITSKN
ncbi:12113_t:CDS:2 [Acaulospora morrowiae]|uniref:12113_t:CDS:1 n=1 Tax=Acaulospora morrowiae TaxID=94023 RepID=A0A9N9C344_9GLOM|nr:12113_t:CDS:2 [Acaulospora morrowiae]